MIYLAVLLSIAIHSCYAGSKVVVSLYALELGASEALVGILASLYGAVPLFLAVFAGRLADTIGMRAPMIAGALCVVASMLVSALWPGMPALFATAILIGAGFILFNVPIQTLAGALGTPAERTRNYSLLSIGYSTSSLLGPTFGGFAIEYVGHPAAFGGFAALATLPVVALALTGRLTDVPRQEAAKKERSALELLRAPELRRIVISSGLLVSAWELYVFYLPIHAHEAGISPSRIGLILGAFALAAILVRFALPWVLKRVSEAALLTAATLFSAAGFLALPLFSTAAPLMALSFAIGLGMGCGQPVMMTLAYNRSPAGRSGEVAGLRLMANNVARVAVPLVSGALGAAFGTAPVFWINAANLVVASRLAGR